MDQINKQLLDEIQMKRKEDPILTSVSIGYSYYDSKNQNIEDVIEEADWMMYEHKRKRKEGKA